MNATPNAWISVMPESDKAWIYLHLLPATTEHVRHLRMDRISMFGEPLQRHIEVGVDEISIRNVTMFAGQVTPVQMLKLSVKRLIRGKNRF